MAGTGGGDTTSNMTQSQESADAMVRKIKVDELTEKLRSMGATDEEIRKLVEKNYPVPQNEWQKMLSTMGTAALQTAAKQQSNKLDITKLPSITPPTFQPQMLSGGGGGRQARPPAPYSLPGLPDQLARMQASRQQRQQSGRGMFGG